MPPKTKVDLYAAIAVMSGRGRLCAAIVDRLTFGGNLIQTGTDSCRLAITQARAAAQDGRAG